MNFALDVAHKGRNLARSGEIPGARSRPRSESLLRLPGPRHGGL
jgi:hypothetical protein